MGLATSAIADLDEGLGNIQSDLASVATTVGRDAKDLRELAQRLLTVAGNVKEMEDYISDLRDRSRVVLSSLDTASDSEEVKDVDDD
jgi:ABC-type transporter Mla subunit MlaD